MVAKLCVVLNCPGNYSNLYKFPKDRKYEKRITKWLSAIGNKALLHLPEKLLLERAVCNIHFEAKYFFRRGLSRSAVPSLYLPAPIDVPLDHFSYVEAKGDKNHGSSESKVIDERSTSESNRITEGVQMHRNLRNSREENKERTESTKIQRKVLYCNQRRLKLGSLSTILTKEARFQEQHDVLVETNCTAQDVAIISEKENYELRRNVLMEINSTDNNTGPASIIEQVPEASIIVEYSDSPTTSKEILIQEKCSSRNKTDALKGKYESVTACEVVSHDHPYEATPRSLKKKLNALRIKYNEIVKENRILRQSVGRLKMKVNSLQDIKRTRKARNCLIA